MINQYLKQSPLANLDPNQRQKLDEKSNRGCVLIEKENLSQIILSVKMDYKKLIPLMKNEARINLPIGPNSQVPFDKNFQSIWLSPDEWLIASQTHDFTAAANMIKSALKNIFFTTVNVTDSRSIFAVTGENSQEILSKGCTIDLHPTIFKAGHVANTILANTPVIIQRVKTNHNFDSFDIFVFRSYAYHLWSWFEDASKEYEAVQ